MYDKAYKFCFNAVAIGLSRIVTAIEYNQTSLLRSSWLHCIFAEESLIRFCLAVTFYLAAATSYLVHERLLSDATSYLMHGRLSADA